MSTCREDQLYLLGIREKCLDEHTKCLDFKTTRGGFTALYNGIRDGKKGAIMLGGFDNGFDGPCSIYPRLSQDLLDQNIATLRLSHRTPGDCLQCSIDTLLALQYLDDELIHDVVLIGWSFGGAVAMSAGSVARNVRGIAALSASEAASSCMRRLEPMPLLLLHGEDDQISPLRIARKIHSEAVGPRRLIVYPNADHSLTQVKERLYQDLMKWVLRTLKAKHLAA